MREKENSVTVPTCYKCTQYGCVYLGTYDVNIKRQCKWFRERIEADSLCMSTALS